MQHRYAGDVGDYFKLFVLRELARNRKPGVIWWLHPDEGNSDGRYTTYLDNPSAWRPLDPELFDTLSDLVGTGQRSVIALESRSLLPTARYVAAAVPSGRHRHGMRAPWFAAARTAVADCDLVFVNPDNGIDCRADADRFSSAKHVTLSEVKALRSPGRALVVYHHQTRRLGGHVEEIGHLAGQLQEQGFGRVIALRAKSYSPRVFFVLDADKPLAEITERLSKKAAGVLERFEFPAANVRRSDTSWPAAVLTLYPEMFPGPLAHSLAGKALSDGVWSLDALNIRDFATDRHRSVDDTPAGGGPGMVLRADILAAAVDAARERQPDAPVVAMTPRGLPLTQRRVRELAAGPGVTILCGRFEGFDERIFEGRAVEEVSVGDYILSGGEPAALVLLDACVRLLPGVMGAASSGEQESFESGLLEYPHYTRPVTWEGRAIPEVLRSGDHAKIAAWRQTTAEGDTRLRRPDLWERHIGARVPSPSGTRRRTRDEEA